MTPDQINQLTDIVVKGAYALVPFLAGWAIYFGRTALNQLVVNKSLRDDIDAWVKAAAQTIPDKSARYAYVAKQASQAYPGVNSDKINALIEAGVAGFKAQLGTFTEATAPTPPALPALDPSQLTALAAQLVGALTSKPAPVAGAVTPETPAPSVPADPAPAPAPAAEVAAAPEGGQ